MKCGDLTTFEQDIHLDGRLFDRDNYLRTLNGLSRLYFPIMKQCGYLAFMGDFKTNIRLARLHQE